ncbi:hypothetical protein [Streptomyces sp. NPDC097610]|uniref:hypothetical protein n=1 Tax=Streptomyces sp. NPDC097610 TaxID=3157227 RepID=UPI0033182EBF
MKNPDPPLDPPALHIGRNTTVTVDLSATRAADITVPDDRGRTWKKTDVRDGRSPCRSRRWTKGISLRARSTTRATASEAVVHWNS